MTVSSVVKLITFGPHTAPIITSWTSNFVAAAQKEVYKQNPDSIDSLLECVKRFPESYDEETVKKVSGNMLKQARLYLRGNGGHFNTYLKKMMFVE